jgi:hypothetical protein
MTGRRIMSDIHLLARERKTVARHVSNIFDKLGVSTRSASRTVCQRGGHDGRRHCHRGVRCAGSPPAFLLARRGFRVLLVDRATFQSSFGIRAGRQRLLV